MEQTLYHVLLEGRRIGPYDRRTIVGMRIRNALASDHVLIGADGARLSVGDLIRKKRAEPFYPSRSGSFSLVQATYTASLAGVQGRGFPVPRFRGELETRLQTDVLRLAGRCRQGFGWKDGRVKIPLKAIVHARVRNSLVDLWLRPDGAGHAAKLQRLTLELFTPDAAGELVEWLPDAKPWPGSRAEASGALPYSLVAALSGIVLAIALVLVAVLWRTH